MIYPYYAQNFSIPEIRETIKGSPAKSFGTVRQKEFRQNRGSPIIQKNSRYENVSETQKGSPTIFLVLWDKKFATEKRDKTFLCVNFFDTRN